ncbi:MAG: CotH kinase family protein [Myxococcales bacterium]|nr:CotH kinase family protein [Myxococcales bacterium]
MKTATWVPMVCTVMLAASCDSTSVASNPGDLGTDTRQTLDVALPTADVVDASAEPADVAPGDADPADTQPADIEPDDAPAPDTSDASIDDSDTTDLETTPIDVEGDLEGPDVPPPPPPHVIVSEVECAAPEWVELLNKEPSLVDVSGWRLSDEPDGGYVLPEGTFIAKGGRLLVRRQSADKDGFTFGLSCGKDTVWLLSADGQTADQLTLPPANTGASVARLPDPAGATSELPPAVPAERTPGEPNLPLGALSEALFDPLTVTEIDLELTPAALAKLNVDPKLWIPATVTLKVAGETVGPLLIGARLKGGWGSFQTLDGKAAWKLRFDWADEDDRLLGLQKLTLNNMIQDASVVHEALAYRLFRALGIAAPRVGYAWLRINGEPYGLYSNIETLEDTLLARTYTSTDHLYEGAYFNDVTPEAIYFFDVDEGDGAVTADLEALAAAAVADVTAEPPSGEPGDAWWTSMAGLIDGAQMQLNWAAEAWIGHWDGYALNINNFYLHSDHNGRFTMLPWGTDQTFLDRVNFLSARGLLFVRCLESPMCLEGYAKQVGVVSATAASLDLGQDAVAIAATLAPWLAEDTRRPYSVDDHAASLAATLAFLDTRADDALWLSTCAGDGPEADADGDGVDCLTDCAPDDPLVAPGFADVCGDGLDQDCSGYADDAPECPDFTAYERDGRTWLVGRFPRSFADARARCLAEGLDLWVVSSPGEWEWLATQSPSLRSADHWQGLSWIDGTGWATLNGELPTDWAWGDGEPNGNQNEPCAVTWANGRWNDVPCEHVAIPICESPCGGADVDGDGATACGADCDDGDGLVSPFQVDVCSDGVDQDCNGVTDDGAACPLACTPTAVPNLLTCPKAVTWFEARDSCAALGGRLASADTVERHAEIVGVAMATTGGHDGVWLGLRDLDVEGEWVWEGLGPVTFTVWSDGQPDDYDSDEDCGGYFYWGEWNDWSCGAALPSLCDITPPVVPVPL